MIARTVFTVMLVLAGCTGTAPEARTTEVQALEIALAHLDGMNVPYTGRRTSVSLEGDTYTVVFHLPEGMLGGDFTVRVRASSGDVLDTVLER